MALRCLIVDDNPHFLHAARDLLEREGVAVVGVASTGDDALQRVAEVLPDVALVDVDLAGESGFEVARRIAGESALEGSQVVLISTYAEEDFADLIADAPVAGFISKSRLSAHAVHEVLDADGDGQYPSR